MPICRPYSRTASVFRRRIQNSLRCAVRWSGVLPSDIPPQELREIIEKLTATGYQWETGEHLGALGKNAHHLLDRLSTHAGNLSN